ncbi:MAG: type II toxin-antitoxin system VapB family antitoxin [Propionibacteriaceae bacterium]|jgi:hypothetical protein|nr:type II toxin-antitoxin system VapB family antitoxin [Propionibacteriaceae bacterium]
MAISIKNPRAVEAVKRLSAHYGTSYAEAIERAAEAALGLPDDAAQARAMERLGRIVAAYNAELPVGQTLDTDQLYDRDGLPR